MANEKHVGDLIRQARLDRGLTQVGLANKAGISPQAVQVIETGRRRTPRVSTLLALRGALDLSDPAFASWLELLEPEDTEAGAA